MYNDDNYDIDNDYNLADINGNISPPVIHRQNAFGIRNINSETSYSSDYLLNEFTQFTNEIFFLEREISIENQIDIEINLDEIINRSIPDELDILSSVDPPSLRKIQSEYKESITMKSFNVPPTLTKFYSF